MKFLDYKSFWQCMPYPTAYYHRNLRYQKSLQLLPCILHCYSSLAPHTFYLSSRPAHGRQANSKKATKGQDSKKPRDGSLESIHKAYKHWNALLTDLAATPLGENLVERDPCPYIEHLHKVQASSWTAHVHCWRTQGLLCPLPMEPCTQAVCPSSPTLLAGRSLTYRP